MATLEQKENKFREALDILNQLLVEFPEDAVLYVARADVERDMKHDDLALVDLDEAIRWQKRTSKKLFRWECLLPMFTNRCNNANNPEK